MEWQCGGENSQLSSRSLQQDGTDDNSDEEIVSSASESDEEHDDIDSSSSSESSDSDDPDDRDDAALAENAPTDDNVTVHEITWTRVESVSVDRMEHGGCNTRLLWHDSLPVIDKKELDFFLLMFPTACIGRILDASKVAWPADSRPTDRYKLFKVIGLMFAMTTHVLPSRRMYWETEDDLFPAPAFGSRYGMSRCRFEDILRYLSLDDESLSSCIPGDQWFAIRSFVEAFNQNMETNVCPGKKLCIDESMCSWRGRGDFAGGMPHVTKIARKPRVLGWRSRISAMLVVISCCV